MEYDFLTDINVIFKSLRKNLPKEEGYNDIVNYMNYLSKI